MHTRQQYRKEWLVHDEIAMAHDAGRQHERVRRAREEAAREKAAQEKAVRTTSGRRERPSDSRDDRRHGL